MSGIPVISLDTLDQGAVAELFQHALDEVLENIEDPNTNWKTVRAITVEIAFAPSEDRRMSNIRYQCSTKLAGTKPGTTVIAVGRHEGVLAAVEMKQEELFPTPVGRPHTVIGG